MLIPVPLPTYTVSPLLPPLTRAQRSTVEAGLRHLSDSVASAIVTGIGAATGRHVIELTVNSGRLMLLERIRADV